MQTDVELRLATDASAQRTIEALWQLYRHDLSEFRGYLPDHLGRFDVGRLPSFFSHADRCAYLFVLANSPVGFGMVRGLTEQRLVVAEFFVVRAARRRSVGTEAALRLIQLHPDRSWAIPFQESNVAAGRFWRRVASGVAGDDWQEEVRPVNAEPPLDPDTWLLIDALS